MILKTVRITEYKCINDSTEFAIDEKVTCLVGKNESGKTAILHALCKLNASDPASSDFSDLEFPRHSMSEFKERNNRKGTLPIRTTWQLTPDDQAALAKLVGPNAAQIGAVTLSKSYSNENVWEFPLEGRTVIVHLLDSAQLHQDERAQVSAASDVPELKKLLAETPSPSQRQKDLLSLLETKFGPYGVRQAVVKEMSNRLPRFAYFSEYLRMPGNVSLSRLKTNQITSNLTGGDKVFLALLDMVGRTVENLEGTTQFEPMIAELEGVSNRLTREIFSYWSQNRHLRVQFRFEQGMAGDPAPFNSGWVLRTRIENVRHGVTTSFDDRSAGFVWFFSFLVWFNQIKKNYGQNVILLLDEPGLSLHAAAQGDLLRFFEERLAPRYQLIYTTHSPFMVDAKNLLRARTVEDVFEAKAGQPPLRESETGTKVGSDVLSTDRDTLFPLQASLGFEITQTLFIGPRSLLVEGPSDLLYLLCFRRRLELLGRIALDKRWTVVPCGGLDKIGAFLSLFGANQIQVAVLTDLAPGDKRKVRDIRESKLLKAGHVFSADAYAGKAEADIEDMIGDVAYCAVVNQCYGLTQPVQPSGTATRVVEHVEKHFRLVVPAAPEFDHYRPAEFLTQQKPDVQVSGLDAALNNFERLFKDLNDLL